MWGGELNQAGLPLFHAGSTEIRRLKSFFFGECFIWTERGGAAVLTGRAPGLAHTPRAAGFRPALLISLGGDETPISSQESSSLPGNG